MPGVKIGLTTEEAQRALRELRSSLKSTGLSTEKTAELLGVSLWDMASYIGQSHIGDAKVAISMPVKERIKIAEDLFG